MVRNVKLCSLYYRYVILDNDQIDLGWLLKDIEANSNSNHTTARYMLTTSTLGSIINSMDTEYDKNALKAVLFATQSRKEISELGIKDDRAGKFLKNTINASEECKNALIAAEDMLQMRYAHKRKLIDNQINEIDTKISKMGKLLHEKRKKDLLTEKRC